MSAVPPPGVAVVLAAGAGTRYLGPTHKLLAATSAGTTLLGRAVAAAVAAGFTRVGVVVGALGDDELPPLPGPVEVVRNPAWADGQAGSLAVGVAWARDAGAPQVVVGLGDQPGLAPAAWRAVAVADATPVAVATYGGRRGHPVRLAAAVWPRLPTSGDRGARDLLRSRPDLVTEVPCPGDPADVDTAADLAAWRAAHPDHPGSDPG